MAGSLAWEQRLLQRLNSPTPEKLKAMPNALIMREAVCSGWKETGASNKVIYGPDADRRYLLGLPVTRGDYVGLDYLNRAYDSRGVLFTDEQRACDFIKARLEGAWTQ